MGVRDGARRRRRRDRVHRTGTPSLDASLELPLDGLTVRSGGIALGLAVGLAFLLLRNRVPVETAVEEPAT